MSLIIRLKDKLIKKFAEMSLKLLWIDPYLDFHLFSLEPQQIPPNFNLFQQSSLLWLKVTCFFSTILKMQFI